MSIGQALLPLRVVHDDGGKVLADAPGIHQPLDLAHLAAMVVLPVFRDLIRDVDHVLKTALLLLQWASEAFRHLSMLVNSRYS